jgi:Family of unknown function (DUF6496)
MRLPVCWVCAVPNPPALIRAKEHRRSDGRCRSRTERYPEIPMTTKKQREKVEEVMHEFKEGDLHIGKSGKAVKNPKQAIAIALSESGQSRSRKKDSAGGRAKGAHKKSV